MPRKNTKDYNIYMKDYMKKYRKKRTQLFNEAMKLLGWDGKSKRKKVKK
jgi:hypothetical protein